MKTGDDYFAGREIWKTCNTENPELYAAFPYHLYGVGKPDLELARHTYAARLFSRMLVGDRMGRKLPPWLDFRVATNCDD